LTHSYHRALQAERHPLVLSFGAISLIILHLKYINNNSVYLPRQEIDRNVIITFIL
jgi:hypothetical protein